MSTATLPTAISPEALQRNLRRQVFPDQPGPQLYVILDGASIPDLQARLRKQEKLEYACLYRGQLEPDIAEVAPYLSRLEPESSFTEWVLTEVWGAHAGILALSSAGLKSLRKHFRTFLRVHLPTGQPAIFRYYDPRVWRRFLPVADASQLDRLFGAVRCYWCEGTDMAQAILYQYTGTLKAEVVDLRQERRPPVIEPAPAAADRNGSETILLRVRPEQLQALAQPRREQLAQKTAQFLRDQCPKETVTMSEAELKAFIVAGFGRAAGLGLSIEWDLCRFCWLAMIYGAQFDAERDWARKVLALAEDSPTERMDALEAYHRNYLVPLFNPA